MSYCIYIHTSPSNKSYIGFTSDYETRCKSHKKPSNKCVAFANAIQKYGWDTFTHIILKDNIETIEEAKELEQYYIDQYNTIVPLGYNLTYGGAGGISNMTKDKIKTVLLERYGVDNPGKLPQSKEKAKLRMKSR